MYIDRGPKVDMKMYEANLNLQRKVKDLEYDLTISNKKLKKIKELCETLDNNYPQFKAYTSRIVFIIEKSIDDYD